MVMTSEMKMLDRKRSTTMINDMNNKSVMFGRFLNIASKFWKSLRPSMIVATTDWVMVE